MTPRLRNLSMDREIVSSLTSPALPDIAVVAEPTPKWSDKSLFLWSERSVVALPKTLRAMWFIGPD